jgi:hypothetical protein
MKREKKINNSGKKKSHVKNNKVQNNRVQKKLLQKNFCRSITGRYINHPKQQHTEVVVLVFVRAVSSGFKYSR